MSSELLTVTGTLSLDGDASVPPGAIATVKLVDGDGEVLAATAISSSEVPTAFTLAADPAFSGAPDALFIWAAVRSSAGTWGTTELVPVDDANAVALTSIEA